LSVQVVLLVHSNFSPEVISYVFTTPKATYDDDGGEERKETALLQPYKIPCYQPDEPLPAFVAVSDAEMRSRYCVERVGDEERDYPGVMEMPVPHCVAAKHPACAQSVGRLIGAVNLPRLLRDVIIDIWGIPGESEMHMGPCWATTTVDGIAYAVLERLCISKQADDGAGAIAEVQMFARHPVSNMFVLERYADQ
jgi:hypothetical protein